MPSLVSTCALAGIFALMLTLLSFQVSLRRAKLNVGVGDGDDAILRTRIRAHGNFIESAPLALVIVAILELVGAAPLVVWSAAALFAVTRVLHALGMLLEKAGALRVVAIVTQHLTFTAAGVWLLAYAIRS